MSYMKSTSEIESDNVVVVFYLNQFELSVLLLSEMANGLYNLSRSLFKNTHNE